MTIFFFLIFLLFFFSSQRAEQSKLSLTPVWLPELGASPRCPRLYKHPSWAHGGISVVMLQCL